jgi:TPR repeat protein
MPAPDPQRAAIAEADKAYSAQDDARALGLYLPLARSGNHHAQFRAARIYTRDRGVTPNEHEACNWWEASATGGDPTAATNFGLCLESGKGRSQSYALAAQWYRRGADGGNAYGMYNLGLAHEYGRGVAQNFAIAADWFQRAIDAKIDGSAAPDAQRHLKRCRNNVDAARGVPQAQFDLAIDLFNGHEPEVRDERRAMAMMREAATRGSSPEAWHIYGSWLHAGVGGVKSDLSQAAVWIRKAADAGYEQAAIRYADIVLCGIGVKKDIGGGERILRQTIDRGSWQAMNTLSLWYQNGSCGFRKDAALSTEWRAKADAAQRAETDQRLQQRK